MDFKSGEKLYGFYSKSFFYPGEEDKNVRQCMKNTHTSHSS